MHLAPPSKAKPFCPHNRSFLIADWTTLKNEKCRLQQTLSSPPTNPPESPPPMGPFFVSARAHHRFFFALAEELNMDNGKQKDWSCGSNPDSPRIMRQRLSPREAVRSRTTHVILLTHQRFSFLAVSALLQRLSDESFVIKLSMLLLRTIVAHADFSEYELKFLKNQTQL